MKQRTRVRPDRPRNAFIPVNRPGPIEAPLAPVPAAPARSRSSRSIDRAPLKHDTLRWARHMAGRSSRSIDRAPLKLLVVGHGGPPVVSRSSRSIDRAPLKPSVASAFQARTPCRSSRSIDRAPLKRRHARRRRVLLDAFIPVNRPGPIEAATVRRPTHAHRRRSSRSIDRAPLKLGRQLVPGRRWRDVHPGQSTGPH